MINIVYERNIECSVSDTFKFTVSSEIGFDAGDSLKFEIAEAEDAENIISENYILNQNNEFDILLTTAQKALLSIGNYIYRLIITSGDGIVTTYLSGELKMKWGA